MVSSLEDLVEDELLEVFRYLGVWDLIAVKQSSRRLGELVKCHLSKRKQLDFSWPVPFNREKRDDVLTGLKRTILDNAGSNLETIKFPETAHSRDLFDDLEFVTGLASSCPRLRRLPTNNLESQIEYCRVNGVGFEVVALEIESNDASSNRQRKELVELCAALEQLEIVVELQRDIGWIIDELRKRENKLKFLKVSYQQLTPALASQILDIVHCSPLLNEISLNCGTPWNQDIMEIETNCQLFQLLPMVNQFRFHAIDNSHRLHLFGTHITSLEVSVHSNEFNFSFLSQLTRLTYLNVTQSENTQLLEQLNEFLPPTVTRFRTNNLNTFEDAQLLRFLESKGKQIENLEILFYAVTFNASFVRSTLKVIAENCVKLSDLIIWCHYAFSSVTHANCSFELSELVRYRSSTLKTIELSGLLVSRAVFDLMAEKCKSLSKLQVDLIRPGFTLRELRAILLSCPRLYEARVQITEVDNPGNSNLEARHADFYYHYLNGKLLKQES